MRAEYACIVVLSYHSDTPSDVLCELERIAGRYRVELVPLAELEQAASCHGTPLPASLHPSSDRSPKESSPTGGNVDVADDATTRDAQRAGWQPWIPPRPAAGALDHPTAPSPKRKIGAYLATVLLGIAALAVGLLSLWHPVANWAFGEAHRSDLPPVWGVGFLVFPVLLLGIGVWRGWWALALDLEAWRARRHRRERQKTTTAAGRDGN